jgi:hypothetical protein
MSTTFGPFKNTGLNMLTTALQYVHCFKTCGVARDILINMIIDHSICKHPNRGGAFIWEEMPILPVQSFFNLK